MPSPTDSNYQLTSTTADVTAHYAVLAECRIYAATAAGASHRNQKWVREDAFALASNSLETGAIAVADGLGSSYDADTAALIAAQLAAYSGARWATGDTTHWNDLAAGVVRSVSDRLRDPAYIAARRAGQATGESPVGGKHVPPATTLAMAAFRRWPTSVEIWWMVCGDCVVFELEGDRFVPQSVFEPARMDTATLSLPSDTDRPQTGRTELSGDRILMLASDGFAEVLNAEPVEISSAIRRALDDRVSAAKFSTLVDLVSPDYYDDKTAVLIVP